MDQLTSAQISEWIAYDKLDPIGAWRDDYRIAVLDSLIVNIVSKLYAKKGHTPKEISPLDFIPNWSGEKKIAKTQSTEEMKKFLLGLAKSVNKRVEDKKKQEEKNKIPPRKLATRRKPFNRPTR